MARIRLFSWNFTILFGVLLAFALTTTEAFGQVLSGDVPPSGVAVIAHRGNSSAAPENTVAAINSGFGVGADHIEIDVQLTSDGHAVVMHDSSINRTTNGSGSVSNLTLAQIQSYDAGSWFAPKFAGEKVPSLADALLAANGRGRIYLDVKASNMGPAVVAAIGEANARQAPGGHVFSGDDLWFWAGGTTGTDSRFTTFNNVGLTGQKVLGSIASNWTDPGYFDAQKSLGVIGWDTTSMNATFAAAAKDANMLASVYTIDSVSAMNAWINSGVNSMETNYPQRLVELTWISGDMNGDRLVDWGDYGVLAENWTQDVGVYWRTFGDLTGDGLVDDGDYQILLDNWSNGTPPQEAPVPEPASIALLCMGGLMALRRRKK